MIRLWKIRGLWAVALGLGLLAGAAHADDPKIQPLPSQSTPSAEPTTGVIVDEGCTDCQTPIISKTGGILKKITASRDEMESGGKTKHFPRTYPDGTPKVQRGDEKEKVTLGNRRPAKPCLCCYSHINDYTVGSLKTESLFVFGSSRWFFGEKCLKGPPPAIPGLEKEPVTPQNPLHR